MGTLFVQLNVVFVFMISFFILRMAGLFGVERLASWRDAGLGALAIMFLITGASHFTGMKHDLAAMAPEFLPDGLWIIYLSGVCEVLGAIGLLIPRTRRLAGVCLILLLIAVFPANVNAAINDIPLGGEPPTPLWIRTPEQLFYIGMVWWTSIKKRPDPEQPPHRGAERKSVDASRI